MRSPRRRSFAPWAALVMGAALALVSQVHLAASAHAATQLCGATDTAAVNGGEIWQGGAGLATGSFSVTVGGSGGDPTPTPTPTPTPPPGGKACAATLHVDNSWSDGFVATVTVTNSGTTPLTGWSADWSFAGDQSVRNAWNATVTQSGRSVHAANAAYNGALAANASTTFGFQGAGAGPGAVAPTCTPS
ncbi:MAG: cellulose binding domain-containing protein [Actinoallomurus sp.]